MKNLPQLLSTINTVHSTLQTSAALAVNRSLTIRNWLIGYYIVAYEQKGEDRAEYGAGLLNILAERIAVKGLTSPELSRCRQFYQTYSYFLGTVSQELVQLKQIQNFGTLTQELPNFENQEVDNDIDTFSKMEDNLKVPPNIILSKLSYSHLTELLKVSDPLKRTFYELECIKGIWSVRELKRQIGSLYFERSGLSAKPEKLAELVQQKVRPHEPKDIIKNIYAFEFLDLGVQSVVEESDLETALLNQLQQFILELGNGFCLEARQKRILIGETYYFIDLVFYHRILKCHVLVELKIGAFEHGDIGQLNTYLNFFKAEITEATDNPPVGILLVAEKDHALVKYATAGMDENLFVQQYLVQLPNQEQLIRYIEKELQVLRG